MTSNTFWGGENVGPEPKVHVVPDYAVRPFTEVEREYLEIYCRCSRLVDQEGTFPQRSAFVKGFFSGKESFLFLFRRNGFIHGDGGRAGTTNQAKHEKE